MCSFGEKKIRHNHDNENTLLARIYTINIGIHRLLHDIPRGAV